MLAKDPARRPEIADVERRLEAIGEGIRPKRPPIARGSVPAIPNTHRLVEDHLRRHPAVSDVAIVGERDRIVRARGATTGDGGRAAHVLPQRVSRTALSHVDHGDGVLRRVHTNTAALTSPAMLASRAWTKRFG